MIVDLESKTQVNVQRQHNNSSPAGLGLHSRAVSQAPCLQSPLLHRGGCFKVTCLDNNGQLEWRAAYASVERQTAKRSVGSKTSATSCCVPAYLFYLIQNDWKGKNTKAPKYFTRNVLAKIFYSKLFVLLR